MKFLRPALACALVFVMGSTCGPAAAEAPETWPTKPLRFIVPGNPGGSPDVFARALAEKMAAILKQPVIVENRPGAGGVIAVRQLQNVSDHHAFIMMVTSVAAVLPVTNKAANFDALRDFTPVANLGYTPMMVVASPLTQVKSLAEAREYSKKQPYPPVFAHAGPGTMSNMAQERTARMNDMAYSSVSFGNPGKTLAALVTGDAQFYADAVSVMQPMLQGDRVVPLAILAHEKLAGMESIPLGKDAIPGLEAVGGFGVMGPKDMTPDEVAILGRAVIEAMQQPDLVARIRELGVYPEPGDAAAYTEILKKEQDVWGKLARSLQSDVQ
ncbi:tripartite tricarboxylate transporter substrate binding protein [Bordetella sp. BOR01]|uniref:Bug family tripartite tricarboxylate transporter substrate binding protein n=1 Tax=Bordetella sp. BOR01 TaxID=2854779 RepID=UPI001C436D24|nr:tripartite tricarboxylate transporter substrate binding protein [Bordetella sp. BOR01]MBV7486697.1 tripartite tricarboxylate transporter substrate binding protein [Bordetella sp. BOR01]